MTFIFAWLFLTFSFAQDERAPGKVTAILVDKKTNTLKLAYYENDAYKIIKEYHATVGKVIGDKTDESDLKTPDGIYQFTSRLFPPQIKPKFGAMALYINFPNPYDRIAARTGYDIMLHGTDEPERLKKNYDSEGCVVVRNEDLLEINKYVVLGLTPIIVFPELTEKYMNPGANEGLKNFFKSWIADWEGKNIEGYISHYHSQFHVDGKDRQGWKVYKDSLNKKYDEIRVNPTQVTYFVHPKYNVISFVQDYQSKFKNGHVAYQSVGTKTLYIAEEDSTFKIIDEGFSPRRW